MKKNVLLATNGDLDCGGITLFMLQWIKGILIACPESSISVYFRETIANNNIEQRFRSLGVNIYTGSIQRGTSFKNYKANRKVRADIQQILFEKHIEILHINSRIFGFNVLLLSTAKKYGVPVRIAHAHGAMPEKLHDRIIHYFMKRRIRSLATVCAGCSKTAGEYLFGKEGIDSLKWKFVPNTICTEKYRFDEKKRIQRRRDIGITNSILLGAVGHLIETKNHIFLIRLINDLIKDGIDARLIIIGEGDKRPELEDECRRLGIEKEVFLPGLSNDVPGWLSAMDYYVMPSLSEGLPLSAVEAQANGLICLLSDRISRESDLTADVYHISIDHGTEEWVDVLKKIRPNDYEKRNKAVYAVEKAGFDEGSGPSYVTKIYLENN